MAKKMGLLNQESTDKWISRVKRSIEYGKNLHAQNLADQERVTRETEAEILNPSGAELPFDGDATAKIVAFESLDENSERASQDLTDFGIEQ